MSQEVCGKLATLTMTTPDVHPQQADKEAMQCCVKCGWHTEKDFAAGGKGGIRCLCELDFKFLRLPRPRPKVFTFSAKDIAMSKSGRL
jgi:hypothetical protein